MLALTTRSISMPYLTLNTMRVPLKGCTSIVFVHWYWQTLCDVGHCDAMGGHVVLPSLLAKGLCCNDPL